MMPPLKLRIKTGGRTALDVSQLRAADVSAERAPRRPERPARAPARRDRPSEAPARHEEEVIFTGLRSNERYARYGDFSCDHLTDNPVK